MQYVRSDPADWNELRRAWLTLRALEGRGTMSDTIGRAARLLLADLERRAKRAGVDLDAEVARLLARGRGKRGADGLADLAAHRSRRRPSNDF
jgi:hypothetical protein